MKLAIRTFDLPLRHTFTISRGSTNVQSTLIVELSEGGHAGYGEATTNPYYGATLESMSAALAKVTPLLENRTLDDPAAWWEELAPQLAGHSFARSALDQAAHDLWGKLRGKPVYELWGLSVARVPPSSYTIGIDTPKTMVARLQEFPGWPVYKIKLGTPHDVELVCELRRHTAALFRVDANCGWTADRAAANAHDLSILDVEFIEQPLPADDWPGMKRLFRESVLPIIADESCQTEQDVERCAGHFHGINIKLVKCGGLTPARRMIERARRLGLRVMIGCMTESTVGISAAAQLLPLVDYADLDGAVLLARDIASGVTLERGQFRWPQENGCGVRLQGN
jgi:L-alanine-DL-glutamate epimerase-like enolase superfamily enzyme